MPKQDEIANKTEYVPDEDLTPLVNAVMANEELTELQDIRDNSITIHCCMRVKLDSNGDSKPYKGAPCKLKKVSDAERAFMHDNAQYVLIMDYGFWNGANERQRVAHIFDALQDIEIEDGKSGPKLKKRASDVIINHMATIRRFGAFDEPTLNLQECYKDVGGRLSDFLDDKPVKKRQAPKALVADDDDQAPEPDDPPRVQVAVMKPSVKKE